MKKLISISLALLMLVSNVSFAMNTHFCGGIAVKTSFSLGLHNPDCGMDDMDMDTNCESFPPSETQVKSKPCCENQHQLVHLDENGELQSSSINVNPIFFLTFVQAILQPITFKEQTFQRNTNFLYPLPEKDLKVLFQSFLI